MAKRGSHVVRKKPAGPVRRFLDWALLSHLEAIDREQIDSQKTSDGRILVVIFTSCLVLWLLNYVVLGSLFQRKMSDFLIHSVGIWGPVGEQGIDRSLLALTSRMSWAMGCMFFYLVIPLSVYVFVLKRRVASIGLSPRGFLRHLWIYAMLFLPVGASVWVVSYQEAFQHTYPFYKNPSSLGYLLIWEAFYALQFFSLEVFFRGFMLSELKHRWGWRSVLFMVTPYCMIHFTKPSLEALGAIIAGSILGLLALRTRNIWGGVAIHVAVAWSMDFAALAQKGWFGKLP